MLKNQVRKKLKNQFELDLLTGLKQGLNPSKIAKQLNISLQNLSYYLKSMRERGLIEKKGYGVWEVKEVKKSTKDTLPHDALNPKKLKEIRGHAFIWKIKVPKENKGYNSIEKLRSKNIKFKLVGIKDTPRITLLDKKIWLGNSNIIIYDSNSYLAINSIESRKYAVCRLLSILESLESQLKINLKTSEGYQFKPRREHYGIIKNDLAIQCRKDNTKLYVKYKGETWFIVDNSYNLEEAETIGKQAMQDNLGMQRFFNEMKETNFEVTPKFILNVMNGIQQNQLIFDRNMKSHLEVLNKIGDAIDRLAKIKKKVYSKESQTQLKDY